MFSRLPIRFCGTGAYVPEEVIDNQHFVDYLDTSHEWIVSRTGITERRRAAKDEYTSTLAARAAERALADANLKPTDLDVIVCATATGDCQFPATATFMQAAIGATDVPAFDVGAACAGFLYATAVAGSMISSGLYRRALVVGAETLTRFAKKDDRRTVVLFGDGAGAAVIESSPESNHGILYCDLGTDGTKADYIMVPAGGSRLPASATTVAEQLHTLHMNGREVYKFAVKKMLSLIDRALDSAGMTPDDLKMVIPHQSNLRIIESVREKMGLPREKICINIDRFGNTSAASIIMGLDEHRRNGTLQSGDAVLMIAIGAGLSWGSMIIRL